MSGLISRAFLAGSADPARYCKKYPAVTRPTKGGYEIQTTPDELAAVISHVKPYLKGHRMLCLGAETLGAERFLAENLGVLEMDVAPSEAVDFAASHKNIESLSGVKVGNGFEPKGRYDVVTVYGTAKLDNILDHVKIGSFIVFIGTTVKENPTLRNLWMQTRKAHMAQLQTGGLPFETGVGVAKVLFCNPDKEVVRGNDKDRGEAGTPQTEKPSEAGNAAESTEVQAEVRGDSGERDGGGLKGDGSEAVPVKRRGRPPRKAEA